MTFVDSSAWYAAYVPTDPRHLEVSQRLRAAEQSFVTTDFVVDETITLMIARRERQRAIAFGQDMLITGVVPLEMISLSDMIRANQYVITYRDKDWSFTDARAWSSCSGWASVKPFRSISISGRCPASPSVHSGRSMWNANPHFFVYGAPSLRSVKLMKCQPLSVSYMMPPPGAK